MDIVESQILYTIVRADLPAGLQIAQSLHAAVEYSLLNPQTYQDWHEHSNYVVCLSARDVSHLETLKLKLSGRGIDYAHFYEPDLGNELTALSFIADRRDGNRVVASLPLALKQETQDE